MNHSSGRIPLSRWLVASLVLILLQLFVDLNLSLAKEPKHEPKKKSAPKAALTPKAPSDSPSNLPPVLLQVEKTYQKSATLEANFTQISHVAMTGAKKETSGIVMVHRPNRFRWETLKPEKNLLVSDGTKYWFYTPPFEAGERGQVVQKKSKEVQSELANQLLSGAFSKMKTTKIEDLGGNRFRLTPAAGSAGSVLTAEVDIEPKKSLIEKVILAHDGGNRVEISLKDVKLGTKIDDGYFTFATPPDTDTISE